MSEPTVSCNMSNCPTCESPGKHLHPAMQSEGEVQPCRDPWHIPSTSPRALTREQVEECIEGGDAEMFLKHDAALRQVNAQQAQELASVDEILSRRPALAECATRSEKIELAINTAKRVDVLAQEIERLTKDAEGQAVRIDALRKYLASAITEHHNAEIKLAAMTAERDERESKYRALLKALATLQATLAEREQVIEQQEATIRGYRHSVEIVGRNHDDRKAERDAARQDAARLREALRTIANTAHGTDHLHTLITVEDQAQRALRGHDDDVTPSILSA